MHVHSNHNTKDRVDSAKLKYDCGFGNVARTNTSIASWYQQGKGQRVLQDLRIVSRHQEVQRILGRNSSSQSWDEALSFHGQP